MTALKMIEAHCDRKRADREAQPPTEAGSETDRLQERYDAVKFLHSVGIEDADEVEHALAFLDRQQASRDRAAAKLLEEQNTNLGFRFFIFLTLTALTLAILYGGEPDLLDGLVAFLMK